MTVDVVFQLDTSDGISEVSVRWPIDCDPAANKLNDLFAEASGGGSAMQQVYDHGVDTYVFINTMKVANVVIETVE